MIYKHLGKNLNDFFKNRKIFFKKTNQFNPPMNEILFQAMKNDNSAPNIWDMVDGFQPDLFEKMIKEGKTFQEILETDRLIQEVKVENAELIK